MSTNGKERWIKTLGKSMSRKDRTLLILAVLALVVFPLLINALILVSDLSKSHPSLMSIILDISVFLAVLTTVAVVGVKALMRTKTTQLLASIRKVIANESSANAKSEKKPEQGRKTSPSDIRRGGLCTGLNMSKERADRAMAALLERAERAANRGNRPGSN